MMNDQASCKEDISGKHFIQDLTRINYRNMFVDDTHCLLISKAFYVFTMIFLMLFFYTVLTKEYKRIVYLYFVCKK